MGVPGNADLLLLKTAAAAGGYQVSRSLRFDGGSYLDRTPASTGNRKKWTYSSWVKRSALVSSNSPNKELFIVDSGTTDNDYFQLGFRADSIYVAGYGSFFRQTSAVYRDPSAWYHIVLTIDTTQATGNDRIKLYVNGDQVTTFSTLNNPGLNDDLGVNRTVSHKIGQEGGGGYFEGYMADIWFLDGIAATPSDFAETDATTGQWIPKAYTGSKGTNGFHLEFADNSAATAAALGKDSSGNGLNWTPNNFSVTAGAGNDSLVDTPTSYGTDAQNGGEVRGNYCTWNPLSTQSGITLADGNLNVSAGAVNSGNARTNSTISVSSGKWYYEVTLVAAGTNDIYGIGQNQLITTYPGADALSYGYAPEEGVKKNNGSDTSYGTTGTTGDVFMCAFDLDNSKVFFGKNGTWFGSSNPASGTNPAYTLSAGTYQPIVRPYASSGTAQIAANFGQRQWAYAAPAGFKALCDTNLTAPVIAKPDQVMGVKLYTGNGSTQTISGLGFSPDLVWFKARNNTYSHVLLDQVRGGTKILYSNTTDAEGTSTGGITAWNSDGFTVAADTTNANSLNTSSTTIVAWAFDGGTSTVSNTQGSITSSVRANASAGFSIVTYTGNNTSGATVGHGLGVAPSLIICKRRENNAAGVSRWQTYHKSIGPTNVVWLDTTDAAYSSSSPWNNTAPSSTVFTLGSDPPGNPNGDKVVAYCWAPVAGYSSFGSYTGNGSTDGPFVYTGFKPKWIMIKNATTAASWWIHDTSRATYNIVGPGLVANASDAEATYSLLDILSNGFKLRTGPDTSHNNSGNTHLYVAFAENPFQHARAR